MNRIIFVFMTALMYSACAVTERQSSITGQFQGRTYWMGSTMTLSIKPDKTFDMNWLNVDYTGKWETLDKNHILLKFNEITDLSFQLQSGVILDKERTVRFINKNKIMVSPYSDVLKREK